MDMDIDLDLVLEITLGRNWNGMAVTWTDRRRHGPRTTGTSCPIFRALSIRNFVRLLRPCPRYVVAYCRRRRQGSCACLSWRLPSGHENIEVCRIPFTGRRSKARVSSGGQARTLYSYHTLFTSLSLSHHIPYTSLPPSSPFTITHSFDRKGGWALVDPAVRLPQRGCSA